MLLLILSCSAQSRRRLVAMLPVAASVQRFINQRGVLITTRVADVLGVKVSLNFQITSKIVLCLQLTRICVKDIGDDLTIRLVLILRLGSHFAAIGVGSLLTEGAVFLDRGHLDTTLGP